jgi:hypothetical protein
MWIVRRDRAARLAWTAACVFYLAHVAAAFQFQHHWSHAAAYAATARQTAEVFGIDWGGGLYFNYIFTMVWVVDATWWWRAGIERYRARRPWIARAVQWFFAFMFFNATVVFGSPPIRWFGLASILVLLTLLASRSRQKQTRSFL